MRTVVLINTHSRQGAEHVEEVKQYFMNDSQTTFELLDLIIIKDLKKLPEQIQKLRSYENLECVVIGSGDGTIVSVLNEMRDRKELTYGFLPLGTSNVFVKSLGLPNDFKEVLEIIARKVIRTVSLGEANGTLFANSASLGVPTLVVTNLTNRTKRLLGPLAYVASGVREFLRHKAFYCILEADNVRKKLYTHHLLIANGQYHGPAEVGLDSSVDNEKLVVVAFGTSSNRWQYAKSMLRFGLNRHADDKGTLIFSTDVLKITTRPIRRIEADGELITTTPAEIKVIKNAIRVLGDKSQAEADK